MKQLLLFISLLINVYAQNQELEILHEVEVTGELRPRYEFANDGVHDSANALTTRVNLGLEAKDLFKVENFGALIEFNGNINFSLDPYNSLQNSKTQYSVIADPAQTRVSKLQLKYLYRDTEFMAGREALELDNSRFMGKDNFRQLYQSFDLLSIKNESISDLEIYGAYLARQQSVAAATSFDGALVLNSAYQVAEPMKIVLYGYLLSATSDTYGASAYGTFISDEMALKYRVEGATQLNPTLSSRSENVSSIYYDFDLELSYKNFIAGLQYEVLGGGTNDGDISFSTPYASLHDFNGEADIFLNTPSGGLIDVHSHLAYATKSFGKLMGSYHFYSSDKEMLNSFSTATTNLGSEIDISYSRDLASIKGVSTLVQAAFYFAGTINQAGEDYTHNVQKIWLSLDYKFVL